MNNMIIFLLFWLSLCVMSVILLTKIIYGTKFDIDKIDMPSLLSQTFADPKSLLTPFVIILLGIAYLVLSEEDYEKIIIEIRKQMM